MPAIGIGVVWLGYSLGLFGYCLLRGYDVTLGQLMSPLHPFGQAKGQSWPPPQIPDSQVMPGKAQAGSGQTTGSATFDGQPVAPWIAAVLNCARSHGWNGHVTSGYRSESDQAAACATGAQPCASPGTSHHQGLTYPDGAVDVSDAAGLSSVLSSGLCAGRGLTWAGDKDPVHFSVPGVWRVSESSY